jgi:hypothetical protein
VRKSKHGVEKTIVSTARPQERSFSAPPLQWVMHVSRSWQAEESAITPLRSFPMYHISRSYPVCASLAFFACLVLLMTPAVAAFPLSAAAWSDGEWETHCRSIRTSYNPHDSLRNDSLSLTPEDPRFMDFLYWVWANKIIEHQVEEIGGTEWDGPDSGVIFHWAPGSRWETHTLMALDHAIHHMVEEHRWMDTMFGDFFERFGPVRGVNIADRLSMAEPPTWTQFLHHIGGPESPYYRYVFHQESMINPEQRTVTVVGGQGVLFEYSLERYLEEIREVLTDCKSYQFFQLFDRYGEGFASKAGWAGQPLPLTSTMNHFESTRDGHQSHE